MSKIAERYSHSVGSSNLKDDEHHTDTSVLAAVALSSPFASLLFRVKYANDASSYKQLRVEWIERVTEKADGSHWPTRIKPWKVAVEALDYWLHDRCEACEGRGYQKHEHAPMLTDVACHVCDGTGTVPFKCAQEIEKYAVGLLDDLNHMAYIGGARAMEKEAKAMEMIFTAYAPDELKK